jgi:hypothetical protein
MEPSVEREDGRPASSPAPFVTTVNSGPAPAGRESRELSAAGQVPWPLIVRLGFVLVVLIIAVVLIALGYTAAAAVGLVLGVGLAATEIIKRLS